MKTFIEIISEGCEGNSFRNIIDNLEDEQIVQAVLEYADQFKKVLPNKTKKAILELTAAVQIHLKEIDRIMKMKESFDRGKLIAQSCNKLDIAHDSMLHFHLGYSFDKIAKLKGIK